MTDIQQYPEIYKLNAKGKALVWYMEQEGSKYRTVSGQLDGNLTTSKYTQAKAKNEGKKNATTAEEQATKEILAKYDKKLSQGSYVKNLEDAKVITFIKPMLAETYFDKSVDPETGKEKVKDNRPNPRQFRKFDHYLQPKLDGVRCVATKEGLFSRQGKPIVGVPHIIEDLVDVFEAYPDVVLDGELYNHDMEFENIISCVRSEPTENDGKPRQEIKYYVYDLVDTEAEFSDRLNTLRELNPLFNDCIKLLGAHKVNSLEEVIEYHDKFAEAGYEGAMLRTGHGPYQQKRSKHLLKVKNFQDAEFTVLDILEGVGNNSGIAAKVVVDLGNGKTASPNMTGSWDFCKTVLDNKEEYIGGEATVKFFGWTEDGSLRFPAIQMLYANKRTL